MKPEILYHYTGAAAFNAIIESGRIRATHYASLGGDPQELTFGMAELLRAVKLHDVSDSDGEFKEYLVRFVERFADGDLPVYVASFTDRRDSEYHWRNYASTGLAIGFCADRVQNGFPIDITRRCGGDKVDNPIRPDPANRFMQCRYIHHLDLPALVSERFFKANSYPAIFRHAYASQGINAALAVSVYQTICSIKRECFVDDLECRSVHLNPDPVDYPIKIDEKGRHFIEMQFAPLDFVKEVWIGPHKDRPACERITESLLKAGRLGCNATYSVISEPR
jgi:hypothetical protein